MPMKRYAKKFAAEPSWDAVLDAPNWFLTMTPIEPAKFVTNAIMKKSANIVAMAATFPPFFSCISIFRQTPILDEP